MTDREIEAVLPHYEGLIRTTTARIERYVELEPEDIQQIFRYKLVKALRAYDPRRSRLARDAFIFGAIANQKKDILSRKRRGELSLDAMAEARISRDHFDMEHGLVATPEEVYGRIEDDDLMLPSTLTEPERKIVVLLYCGRLQVEAAVELGLTKSEMERAIRSIRVKLADWRPSSARGHGPTPPLPGSRARVPAPAPARLA